MRGVTLAGILLAAIACGLLVGSAGAASPVDAGSADASGEVAGVESTSVSSTHAGAPVRAQVGDEDDEPAQPDNETDGAGEEQSPAAAGVEAAAERAQQQGVDVDQSQIDAVVERIEEAAAEYPNASDEAVTEAATGAATGAFVQSQQANVTQLQAAAGGATAGALSQSQNASVSQLQAAAYGAAHGGTAHSERANETAIEAAARGGAEGAATGAIQAQNVTVAQVQEAAQGSAYGALEQRQSATVEQIQAAATGAGEGVANVSDADPKQVQAATIGAAKGALAQTQTATVGQIQAAAKGACEGALRQHQNVTVVQIQKVANGAADGALRQSQTASVRQLQAAATGAASGTLVQIQQVTVVQLQQAAAGAASGAAGSAAQRQVVDVRQIQAAAFGAGQGSVVQIQQVNVIQIQTIAEGAARGALSQHQQASVTQIQSAARGASEGTIEVTQRQRVTIEQAQTLSERTATETVRTAIDVDVTSEVVVYQYARGKATDPDDDADDLRSLFADVEDGTLFLANPNTESVTVTVTNEAGDLETITLAPGESVTQTLEPGTYTLTAETAEGETVKLSGRTELRVTVGEELESLTSTVEDGTLVVANPNDEHISVTIRQDGTHVLTFVVHPGGERTWDLEPGTYQMTAEFEGESVQINDQDTAEIMFEDPTIDLNLSVDDRNVTLDNPSDVDVTVTATNETGADQTLSIGAGENVTEEFTPGNYTLEGEAADDREVLIDGQATREVEIQPQDEEPGPPIDLNVSVEDQNVTLENPGDVDVTVNATSTDADNWSVDVPAGENVTETVEPGNYTLSATAADDRTVTIEGNETHPVSIAAPDGEPGGGPGEEPAPPAAIDLNVTVDGQNVTIANPNATAATVTAAPETGDNVTLSVPADGNVTETLEPGNYTLTGTADENRSVTLNGEAELNITIPEADLQPVDLAVSVTDQNVTIENPSETAISVVAAPEDGQNQTIEVPAAGNATETLAPGNYTLSGSAADDRPVTIEGNETHSISIAPPDEEPEGPIALNVTVDGQNVTIANPNATAATVTAAPEVGDDVTVDVPAQGDVTEALQPGNYTLTGTAAENRSVTLNGESQLAVNISEPEVAPVDLAVSVAGQNVTIENPNTTNVSVTAAPEVGQNESVQVPAGDNVTAAFEPGNYTLTGMAEDGRDVTLDGQAALPITVNETTLEPANLTVGVAGQNVTVDNPSPTNVTVNAASTDAANWTVDVPAGQTVTEMVDPGNYTLSGTAADGRDVLLEGETNLSVTIAPATAPTDFEIGECRTITESGDYELTADLAPDEGPCIEVAAGNVTVDGNGHTIDGSAVPSGNDSVGIASDAGVESTGQEDVAGNVTIRNVSAVEFERGLWVNGSQTRIEDAVLQDNEIGVDLDNDTALANVTIAENDAQGIRSYAFNDLAISESVIRDNDVGAEVFDDTFAIESTVVQDNDEVGLTISDSQGTIQDSLVADNGEGISHRFVELSLDNVSVQGSDEWELGPFTTPESDPGSTIDATDLVIDNNATLAFEFDSALALDGVEQEELPPLLGGANAVGDGINVTELGDSTDLQLAFDGADTVEIWRHNGTEWSVAADSDNVTIADGTVSAQINQSGVYAPIDPPAEAAAPSANVTAGNDLVRVENLAEQPIDATVANESGDVQSLIVEPGESASVTGLAPGNYTLSAQTDEGDVVTVNDGEEVEFTLPPDLQSLALSTAENVTVENTNDVAVTVAVGNESDEVATQQIGASATEPLDSEGLAAGTYTLSATTDDDRRVPIDGAWNASVEIEAEEAEPTESVNATVPGETDGDEAPGADNETVADNETDADDETGADGATEPGPDADTEMPAADGSATSANDTDAAGQDGGSPNATAD